LLPASRTSRTSASSAARALFHRFDLAPLRVVLPLTSDRPAGHAQQQHTPSRRTTVSILDRLKPRCRPGTVHHRTSIWICAAGEPGPPRP
jgi:hypothetical protein